MRYLDGAGFSAFFEWLRQSIEVTVVREGLRPGTTLGSTHPSLHLCERGGVGTAAAGHVVETTGFVRDAGQVHKVEIMCGVFSWPRCREQTGAGLDIFRTTGWVS